MGHKKSLPRSATPGDYYRMVRSRHLLSKAVNDFFQSDKDNAGDCHRTRDGCAGFQKMVPHIAGFFGPVGVEDVVEEFHMVIVNLRALSYLACHCMPR